MTFPDTIPATAYPVPTCPSWCPSPAGHDDGADVPGSWSRFHVAYLGVMTFEDSLFTTAEITVEVAVFEACDVAGEYVHFPPQLRIGGVSDDGPLSVAETLEFAELVREAAATLSRITR